MKKILVLLKRLIFEVVDITWTFIWRFIVKRMGKGCRIRGFSRLSFNTEMGDDCHFNGAKVFGRGSLKIGNHFHSGINLIILTDTHNFKSDQLPYDKTFLYEKTEIGDYVWCGVNVTILPGVKIGEKAIIGAGSVVTKDVAAGTIVAGNPAKSIGRR